MGALEIPTFTTYDMVSRKSSGTGHRYVDNIKIKFYNSMFYLEFWALKCREGWECRHKNVVRRYLQREKCRQS